GVAGREISGQTFQQDATLFGQLLTATVLLRGEPGRAEQGEQPPVELFYLGEQGAALGEAGLAIVAQATRQVGLGVLPGQGRAVEPGVGQDQPLSWGQPVCSPHGTVKAGGSASESAGILSQQGGFPGADGGTVVALGVEGGCQVAVTGRGERMHL